MEFCFGMCDMHGWMICRHAPRGPSNVFSVLDFDVIALEPEFFSVFYFSSRGY